ncbi:MAG: hypothetical protein HC930_03105 [Hydrococcus sp. SU_1_0]|nr:hypothetical protein [Hydrococcus sp. SU_1_0]
MSAQQAAESFTSITNSNVSSYGYCSVALGNDIKLSQVYSIIASMSVNLKCLKSTYFFQLEEVVGRKSNYEFIHNTLLSRLPISSLNIYRIQSEKEIEIAISSYASFIRVWFQICRGEIPSFNIVLLSKNEYNRFKNHDNLCNKEEEEIIGTYYTEQDKNLYLRLNPVIFSKAKNIILI